MNNAKLYHKSNTLQLRDAKQILDDFSHLFKWRSDGTDCLLDIGTGTGDGLVEYIIPKMPKNFAKAIGVDVSEEMTRYAKENYQNKQVDFYKVNIESEFLTTELNSSDTKKCFLSESMALGNYDFITSFYCLHWIHNQRQSITNIYNLLKTGGTCLMAFLKTHPFFDSYLELSKSNKYKDYMNDVNDLISPYHHEEKPLDVYKKYLNDAGFKRYHVELKEITYTYEDLETLKYSLKAVNPFYERMPLDMKDDFLNDCVQVIETFSLNRSDDTTSTRSFIIPYKLMVVNATK
nr:juvenile hormone acid methyltransferase [Diamesa zernyi]